MKETVANRDTVYFLSMLSYMHLAMSKISKSILQSLSTAHSVSTYLVTQTPKTPKWLAGAKADENLRARKYTRGLGLRDNWH